MTLTRRGFFRTVATGMGAGAGYGIGKATGGFMADTLEGAVEALYSTAHDSITELGAIPERRLQRAAREIKDYLGETERDSVALQQYWEEVGLLDKQGNEELQQILTKVESYTRESDLPERLRRLKDRLVYKLVAIDQAIEAKQPKELQKFNTWFSKLVKGEERGSKKALDDYKTRLQALVQVYDLNRDNKLAQADLLSETGGYFAQAQEEVVRQIDSYLASGNIADKDERAFLTGLKDLAQQDPSGRELADYLLNTNNYFKTVEVSQKLHELSDKVGTTIGQVTSLQTLLDQGIALKQKMRDQGNRGLAGLQEATQRFYQAIEAKKKELEQDGHDVEYEVLPRLKEAKGKVVNAIKTLGTAGGVVGATMGGGLLYWLSGIGKHKATRRELLGLKKEVKELKAKTEKKA